MIKTPNMRTLQQLTRPNIWRRLNECKQDVYNKYKEECVKLNKNELPFNVKTNRFTNKYEKELIQRIARIKALGEENIFLGNGEDEIIDTIYRTFCNPGKDNVVSIAPTYERYKECADINDIEYIEANLNDRYKLLANNVIRKINKSTKIIWLCSPNNPTGNILEWEEIENILNVFDGIVVVDEAYIDFARKPSICNNIIRYKRLVVLQSMSYSWGAASIRIGMAIASKDIINILNTIKLPCGISSLSLEKAIELLADTYEMEKWTRLILQERDSVMQAIGELTFCRRVYPSSANFILAKFDNAQRVYDYLLKNDIIVKNYSKNENCKDCLRITIGTKGENNKLLAALRQFEI